MSHSGPEAAYPAVKLGDTPDFTLGGLLVRPARRQLRIDGVTHELEPKVMQVLVALASARPGVVSRDRLVEQCWDGRIVGDDTLNRCIVALRHIARGISPEPFRIETVRGVGYSLVENGQAEAPAADKSRRRALAAVALMLVLVVAAALAFQMWRASRSGRGGRRPRPSGCAWSARRAR
jgi:DNA-binding winged helix-turn-helix (wHTH) protein